MLILRWVLLGLYVLLIIGLSTPFFTGGDGVWLWLWMIGLMLVSQALFIFGGGTIKLCRPIRKARHDLFVWARDRFAVCPPALSTGADGRRSFLSAV